eukprot:1629169-Rhodomonas_salina.1
MKERAQRHRPRTETANASANTDRDPTRWQRQPQDPHRFQQISNGFQRSTHYHHLHCILRCRLNLRPRLHCKAGSSYVGQMGHEVSASAAAASRTLDQWCSGFVCRRALLEAC